MPSRKSSKSCSPAWATCKVATHKTKAISVWRQGDINYIVNAEPGSHAMKFVDLHGPCAASMAWRVVDAKHAFEHAVAKGATPYEATTRRSTCRPSSALAARCSISSRNMAPRVRPMRPSSSGPAKRTQAERASASIILDHLTHNVYRGNMDKWWAFYRDLFGFKQIHFFDIDGRITGLVSRAITSPCGKIRIPLNESKDETSQIVEYLKKYKGEGIQHIAVGTDGIYDATDKLADNGLKFMPGPPETYYERSYVRVVGHEEPVERMKKHGILIDGEGVVDGGMTKILLQIFSKTVIGPIFFEFIQRKGDEGFGEGNFRALFESIEEDQIRRGVLNSFLVQRRANA
jgi:4-hydroxyphenylpyruvate dioxygenase